MSFCGGRLTPAPVRLGAERLILMQKEFFIEMHAYLDKAQVCKGCREHASESHVETPIQ